MDKPATAARRHTAPQPLHHRSLARLTSLLLFVGIGLGAAVLAMAWAARGWSPPALAPAFDTPGGWTEELRTAAELRHEGVRAMFAILAAAAILLLGATCVNAAALLLSRASARGQEMAMRAVLGATPGRLLRQVAGEGGRIVAWGAGLGVAAALLGGWLLRAAWPAAGAGWGGGADMRALVLGAVIPALVALVFALSPAGAGLRRNLYAALTVGGRATPGRYEGEMRRILVVVQFTGSMMLLIGAGMLVRASVPRHDPGGPGFDPSDTLTLRVDAPAAAHADPARRAEMYREMVERLGAIPGVRAASVSSPDAWLGLGPSQPVKAICGICFSGGVAMPFVIRPTRQMSVSPGYFRALGIPLSAGREFTSGDGRGAEPVAVVSRAFGYDLFLGTDPVGKKLEFGDVRYRVVGVVEDLAASGPGASAYPTAALYFSALQHPPRVAGVAVRTTGDPLRYAGAVEAAIRGVEPRAALSETMTMAERLQLYRAPLRWFAWVLLAVSVAALVLGGGGLYGVMAFAVARRTREIGVRMALGARRWDVLRLVLGQAVRLVALAAFAGALGGLTMAAELKSFFPRLAPADGPVFLGVTLLLGGLALVATLVPARRAAEVDPMVALQSG